MEAPFKQVMVLDFETYWDSQSYTLSKMTTEEYIRDSKFKAWGMAYKFLGDDKIRWVHRSDLQAFFDKVDWTATAVIAHNSMFDVAILAWVYGHVPCFIFDTLSMARALHGVEVGNSLAKLAARFNLPPKGKALYSTDGKTVLSHAVEDELSEYCKHDVFLCAEIFKELIKDFPKDELRLIDMTQRMFIKPRLVLDTKLLVEVIEEEKLKRETLLTTLGVTDEDLASNDRFAEKLSQIGNLVPPKKISKQTGKEAWAFAKTDAVFQSLLNSENEEVALLCEARLAVKSTLERTRSQRFLDISARGTLPVPLSYYGAHTGRWAAARGASINLQNLKRNSKLRKAIMAPKGSVLVVGDLSQIEPRVLAYLSDNTDLLDIFKSGADPYAAFGARMFGVPGMTKESHPALRQSAKSALLGAGFGLGWASFAQQLLTGFLGAPPVMYTVEDAKLLGVTEDEVDAFIRYEPFYKRALEIPRICTDSEILIHCIAAKKIIDLYRGSSQETVAFWKLCTAALEGVLSGNGKPFTYKCLEFSREKIRLPNGMYLRYPNLAWDEKEKEWQYGEGANITRLYGGKMTENIVSAVARIVMTDAMLKIGDWADISLTVHDELVVIADANEAEDVATYVKEALIEDPKFMPGIPLACDVSYAERYGDAK
jgi:DNA polymerase